MGDAVSGITKAFSGAIGNVLSIFAPEQPKMPSFMMAPTASGSGAAASSLLAPADPSNGTAQADRDAAAEAERRRVAGARGYDSTNPTGGLGDTSAPNLAAKSLLGQ